MIKQLHTGALVVAIAVPAMVYSVGALAADAQKGHGAHNKMAKSAASVTCAPKLHFTDAAESRPGGALYKGPLVAHHGKKTMQMPEMKGAHMDHSPRQRGAFFMAPDRMHHIEGVYSRQCGLQVFFYNAFTQPIRADRFRAFVRVVPQKEDEPEILRFLTPSKDGSILSARIGDEISRPFDIEAYVKFPQSDEPQLFTIKIAAKPALAKIPEGAIVVDIKNGMVAGKRVIRVKQGDRIVLHVTSDREIAFHLHGYDLERTVRPDRPVTLSFTAKATGRFPVTSHGVAVADTGHDKGSGRDGHGEKPLVYLEVHPK